MLFSNKLADLERLITSYDQKIKRQAIQINHLTAQVDSKADRSQIDAMTTLLNSKMSTVKGEMKTKELVIERNQNQLRNLEADMTVSLPQDGRGVNYVENINFLEIFLEKKGQISDLTITKLLKK